MRSACNDNPYAEEDSSCVVMAGTGANAGSPGVSSNFDLADLKALRSFCHLCLLLLANHTYACYAGVSAARSLAPSTSGNLELLDMPDCILQHISTFVPTQQWARIVTCICRKLDALPLPVMKVCSCNTAAKSTHQHRPAPHSWQCLSKLYT